MKHTKRAGPLLAGVVAACAAAPPVTRPEPAQTPALAADARLAEGRAVFDAVCSTCHSIEPPPKTAPPMSHIARHYRMLEPDSGKAVARIAEWTRAPAAERSALPAHAIQRFGLMPALQLGDDQAAAVAAYVWSLAAEPPRPPPGTRPETLRPLVVAVRQAPRIAGYPRAPVPGTHPHAPLTRLARLARSVSSAVSRPP